MPYFICPNCRRRSVDHDGREDLTNDVVGCSHCGFGFLFELMDDYYPAPTTGFIVCDQNLRILAAGRGVFELTGFSEQDLMGLEVMEALGMNGSADPDPAQIAVEWGVRQLGKKLTVRTRSGVVKAVSADFFPAYDDDGGLLVAISPGQ